MAIRNKSGISSPAQYAPTSTALDAAQPGDTPRFAVWRGPVPQWITPAVIIAILVTGVGFLLVCLGLYVVNSPVTFIVGIAVMDVGIIGWVIAAGVFIAAYIRRYFRRWQRA